MLGLDQLEPVRGRARTADGREIELKGNYAVISIHDIGLREEGLVETASSMREILLGVEWFEGVHLIIDGALKL